MVQDPNDTGSTPTIERTYTAENSAQLDLGVIPNKSYTQTDKTHTDSGDTATGVNAANAVPLSIGETIRYRLQIQVPEGIGDNFVITDNIPAGLRYTGNAAIAFIYDTFTGGSLTTTPNIICTSGSLAHNGDQTTVNSITPNCVITDSTLLNLTVAGATAGADLEIDLGDFSNTKSDSQSEFIVVEFDAIADNVLANQDGESLENTYDVSVGSAVTPGETSAFAEIKEPKIDLVMSATPNTNLATNATVSWTITLENTGNATAFQVDWVGFSAPWDVTNNVGLDGITNLNIVNTGGVTDGTTAINNTYFLISGIGPESLTVQSAPNGFVIPAGEKLTITFDTIVQNRVLAGSNLNTTTSLTYNSQDQTHSAVSRDGSDLISGTGNNPIDDTSNLNDYRSEATTDVTAVGGTISLYVYHDADDSGDREVSEDWTGSSEPTIYVNLVDTGTGLVMQTMANPSTGLNTFNNIPEGDYQIIVTSNMQTIGNSLSASSAPTNWQFNENPDGISDKGIVVIHPIFTVGHPINPLSVTYVSEETTADDIGLIIYDALGIAKTVGSVTNNLDGSYNVAFTITAENLGSRDLVTLQTTDDLTATFLGSSYTITTPPTAINPAPGTAGELSVNPSFDGNPSGGDTNLLLGTDTLAVGETKSLGFVIRVIPDNPSLTYFNQAFGETNGGAVTDPSHNGIDPDPDGNNVADETGNNDPTPIQFNEQPKLGVVKAASNLTAQGDGTFNVTYTITLENMGNVPIENLQVHDDLVAVFGAKDTDCVNPINNYCVVAGSIYSNDFIVNPLFQGDPAVGGSIDNELLAGSYFGNNNTLGIGESGSIEFIVNFNPNGQTEFCNSATGFIDSSLDDVLDTGEINDISTDGSDPDPDSNGNPTEQEPTCITITSTEQIGLAKAARSISGNQSTSTDPVYQVLFEMKVENSGDVPLNNVQVIDDLTTVFTASEIKSFSITTGPDIDTTSDLQENTNYNGDGDINLLTGVKTLNPGENAIVSFTVEVTYNTIDPNAVAASEFGIFNNQGTASGSTPSGTVVTDESHDGGIPDPEGDGPSDNSDPTPVSFPSPVAPVGSGTLEVVKAVRVLDITCNTQLATWSSRQSADPGQCLEYRIVATNSGGGTITAVMISDEILVPSIYEAHDTPTLSGGGIGAPVAECATILAGPYGPCNIGSRFIRAMDNGTPPNGIELPDGESLTLVFRVKIP